MKKGYSRLFVVFCVSIQLLTSCKTVSKIVTSRDINSQLKRSEIFGSQFTGFVLYDPISKEYLKEYNADIHFTPASNTKILTTAASLQTLNDSIPSFSLKVINDTLVLAPYGDPTFLHPDFPSQPVLDKLRGRNIRFVFPEQKIKAFGPGWAWDDYEYSFQAERSAMPIYGNIIRTKVKGDSIRVDPIFFTDYVTGYSDLIDQYLPNREADYNIFNIKKFDDTTSLVRDVPFQSSEELLLALLHDTLGVNIEIRNIDDTQRGEIIYNASTLQTVALMMQRSDNFLAEQLLYVSGKVAGYQTTDGYRSYLINKWNLPSSTRWVDGSGLSRYNLIAPRTFVKVLSQLYDTYDWSLLSAIFPTGGVSGTIRKWYIGESPYVFAKTGTLSNNHSLSGYIKTNSGRTLIFSFMNNNYTCSNAEVKQEMQGILEAIRDAY